jgi:hypothetical protein
MRYSGIFEWASAPLRACWLVDSRPVRGVLLVGTSPKGFGLGLVLLAAEGGQPLEALRRPKARRR